jgi:hypothetical protein
MPQAINTIPKSYIRYTGYRDFHFMAQKEVRRLGYRELKTGHDAKITVPDKVVQIVEKLNED